MTEGYPKVGRKFRPLLGVQNAHGYLAPASVSQLTSNLPPTHCTPMCRHSFCSSNMVLILLVPQPVCLRPHPSPTRMPHHQGNTALVSLVTVSTAICLFHSVTATCATGVAAWLFFCDPYRQQPDLPSPLWHPKVNFMCQLH